MTKASCLFDDSVSAFVGASRLYPKHASHRCNRQNGYGSVDRQNTNLSWSAPDEFQEDKWHLVNLRSVDVVIPVGFQQLSV